MLRRTLVCIPILVLLGLLLTACGADITINVPTIGPIQVGVTAGAEQPTSPPPAANTPAPAPGAPANPDGPTMTLLLFGIIALVIIVALFGLVALMRRPEEPPT